MRSRSRVAGSRGVGATMSVQYRAVAGADGERAALPQDPLRAHRGERELAGVAASAGGVGLVGTDNAICPLLALPVRTVHGGHFPSYDGARHRAIIEGWLREKGL